MYLTVVFRALHLHRAWGSCRALPKVASPSGRSIDLSIGLAGTACAASNLFDPDYYDHIMGAPFRDGTIGRAPVMPGAGLFVPAGTAAGKNKGLFRRTVPQFDAGLCTGCLECALACPDAAIPNAVHEVHTLVSTAVSISRTSPRSRAFSGVSPQSAAA